MIFPIILSILVGLAHYISDKFCITCSRIKIQLVSFIAGISIVYIFLNLYPEFYRQARFVSPFIFTSVLFGFAVFYLIDKGIYQKIKHFNVSNDIKLAHGYGLAVYYIAVGMVLVDLLTISVKDGILFFIPVFIYAGLSTLSSHGIHGMQGPHYKNLAHLNILQTIAVIAGVFIALFFAVPKSLSLYLIGLVAGIMTYTIIRDMLPKGKKGKPLFFILGIVVYSALIIILWLI